MKRIILFGFILFLISCSNKNSSNEINKLTKNPELTFEYIPNTVYLNKTYEGRLHYSSELDTIVLGKNESRYIFLFLTTEKGTFDKVEEIEKVNHLIFGIDDNRFIDFKFKFEKDDSRTLNIILQDMVILENYYDNGKSRIIEHTSRVKYVFIVMENEHLN